MRFPRKNFTPYTPTFQQVKKCFLSRECLDDEEPKLFFAHYEAVGWQIGNQPMVSYKGAIAKWLIHKKREAIKGNTLENRVYDTSGKSQDEKEAEQAQILKAYPKQHIQQPILQIVKD